MRRRYKVLKRTVISGWIYNPGDAIILPEEYAAPIVDSGDIKLWDDPSPFQEPAGGDQTSGTDTGETDESEGETDTADGPKEADNRPSEHDHIAQVAALTVDEVLQRVRDGVWNAPAAIEAERLGKNRRTLLTELQKYVQ